MVWAVAGGGVVLAGLVMAFVVQRRKGIARGMRDADAAQVWLHGDPAPQAAGRDDPAQGNDDPADGGSGDQG